MQEDIQQNSCDPDEAVDATIDTLCRLTSSLGSRIERYRTRDSYDPVKPVMNELYDLFYIVDMLLAGCKNATFNYGGNDNSVDIVTSNYFIRICTEHCVFFDGKIQLPSMTIHRQG